MPVQITINGENATEAIREFAVLSQAFTGQTTTEEKKPRQNKAENAPKKEEKQAKEEPSKPEVVADPEETFEPESPGADDFTPTLIDIRAKAKEKGGSPEGKQAIKDLLVKYAARAVSNVPEDKWSAFYAELDAI